MKIFSYLAILLIIADYFISDLVGLSVLEMLIDRVLGVFNYFLGIGDLVQGESLSWRLEVIFESFYVWFKNPLTGVGLGLFHENSDLAGFSDNSFLAILAEAGPIAAFSFLFIFISSFYHAVKIRKSNDLILNEYQKTMVNMLPYIIVILFEVNFSILANSFKRYSNLKKAFFKLYLNLLSSSIFAMIKPFVIGVLSSCITVRKKSCREFKRSSLSLIFFNINMYMIVKRQITTR